MSRLMAVVPLSFSPDALSNDQGLRSVSFCFGLMTPYSYLGDPSGGVLSDRIVMRGRQPGAVCARSGAYFPGEHLTRDGQGRIVGKPFSTEGPAVIPDTPFPRFSV
jgi:hypothetical protein